MSVTEEVWVRVYEPGSTESSVVSSCAINTLGNLWQDRLNLPVPIYQSKVAII